MFRLGIIPEKENIAIKNSKNWINNRFNILISGGCDKKIASEICSIPYDNSNPEKNDLSAKSAENTKKQCIILR